MRRKSSYLELAVMALSLLLITGTSTAAVSLEFVSPDQWGLPDAEIGLAGGIVEDFEDYSLASGLLVEISDADGNFTPSTSSSNSTSVRPLFLLPAKLNEPCSI